MGKPKIRLQSIETPISIEIKFGTFDYVGEGTHRAKFHANLPERGLLRKCVKYTQKIL